MSPENLVRYKEIDLYMIFDIKIGENVRRNDRLAVGGNKTKALSSITYSSVLLRNLVYMCLLIASLNDLDIWSLDIENSYLIAPCQEKI